MVGEHDDVQGKVILSTDDTAEPSFLDFYSPLNFVISSVWGGVFVFTFIFREDFGSCFD